MDLCYLCTQVLHHEGCEVKISCILDFHSGSGIYLGFSATIKDPSVDTKYTEGWVLHNHSGHGVEEQSLLIPQNEPPTYRA